MKPSRCSLSALALTLVGVISVLVSCVSTTRSSEAGAPLPEITASSPDSSGPAENGSASKAQEAPARLPARTIELPVEGFRPAVVELPPDDGSRYPVIVAAHGAGDGPRYQCAFWRELLGARVIVLCPTGLPLGKTDEDGHYYKDHLALEREVLAAVSALRAELAEKIAPGPLVYVAYSQGATMGSLMLPQHGDVFQRLVLIEGGFEQWNVPLAKKFREAGGTHVLFACGTKGCNRGAERSAEWMRQAGLEARVEYAPGGGHTYGGAVGERVLASLDWLLSGDERFR